MIQLDAPPPLWWRGSAPRETRACYPTKTAALRVFIDANRGVIQNYGGIDYQVSPAEFDAVNHKYDLRGKQAARSISDAIWAALPAQKRPPYCLADIDLEALNDTSPAREYELGFRLPDWAEEQRLLKEQEAWYRSQYEGAMRRKRKRRSGKELGALQRCDMTAIDLKIAQTRRACRPPKDLRSLFNHLLNLARHSAKVGYCQRAGMEIRHAKKLAVCTRR